MILPDDTPLSPSKSHASLRSPGASQDDYALPPPAYPGPTHDSLTPAAPIPDLGREPTAPYCREADVEAQVSPAGPLLAQVLASPRVHDLSIQPHGRRKFPHKRLLKVFAITSLVLFVLGALIRTIVITVHWHNRQSEWTVVDHTDAVSLIPFPKSSDGRIEECVSLSSFAAPEYDRTQPVNVSFELPLSTSVLYVFARGDLGRGSLTLLSTNDPSVPEGSIIVDIIPQFASRLALEKPNICLLERAPGEKSVGILTPRAWDWSGGLTFTIHVRLPGPNHGALHVKTFQDDLPLFSHAAVAPLAAASTGYHLMTQPSWPRLAYYRSSASVSSTSAGVYNLGSYYPQTSGSSALAYPSPTFSSWK